MNQFKTKHFVLYTCVLSFIEYVFSERLGIGKILHSRHQYIHIIKNILKYKCWPVFKSHLYGDCQQYSMATMQLDVLQMTTFQRNTGGGW